MGEKEGITEEMLTREMELGDEVDEAYAATLHRAEEDQLILSYYIEAQGMQRDYDSLPADSLTDEFERDCLKLLKQFSSYLAQVSSYSQPNSTKDLKGRTSRSISNTSRHTSTNGI